MIPALTIRERLAVTLAAGLGAIEGVTFRRAPIVDFDTAELPALGLFMGDEQTEPGPTMDIDVNRTEVTISGHATGEDGETAESAAHALYGQALAVVLADFTQGGLAVDSKKTGLMVTLNRDGEGEIPLAGFELALEIEYWTRNNDATSLAP